MVCQGSQGYRDGSLGLWVEPTNNCICSPSDDLTCRAGKVGKSEESFGSRNTVPSGLISHVSLSVRLFLLLNYFLMWGGGGWLFTYCQFVFGLSLVLSNQRVPGVPWFLNLGNTIDHRWLLLLALSRDEKVRVLDLILSAASDVSLPLLPTRCRLLSRGRPVASIFDDNVMMLMMMAARQPSLGRGK